MVLNAQDAQARGADIRTRTRCASLVRHHDHWNAELIGPDGTPQSVSAKSVVNAAGPWVDEVLRRATRANAPAHLRLVKGSHLVVPKLWDGPHCYIFQNGDGRICFAIPYERDFTLIGTTDLLYEGDLDAVRISEEETRYFKEGFMLADLAFKMYGQNAEAKARLFAEMDEQMALIGSTLASAAVNDEVEDKMAYTAKLVRDGVERCQNYKSII